MTQTALMGSKLFKLSTFLYLTLCRNNWFHLGARNIEKKKKKKEPHRDVSIGSIQTIQDESIRDTILDAKLFPYCQVVAHSVFSPYIVLIYY